MTKEDLKNIVENSAQYFPERMSGNEAIAILIPRMANYVETKRAVVVDLLRDWLALRIPQTERKSGDGAREFWMWLALQVVEKHRLIELKHDVESLISDIHSKKTFLPYYEDVVWKYYDALRDEKK